MDASEPPRIVFDTGTACADREVAEEALRRALERAHAPRSGWVISTRIEAGAASELTAEAEVTDEGGTTVARHTWSGAGGDCAILARSAGEWAALTLDSGAQGEAPDRLPALPAAAPAPVVAKATGPVAASPPRPAFEVWAPEVPVETGDEGSTWELGVGTFLLAGGGPEGDVGISPFLIGEIGTGVFLRPSIGLGKPVSGGHASSTWGAARLDTCGRISGLYARGQGIDLDLCGGADAGFSYIASGVDAGAPPASITQPYVDLGPSVDLRAQVGRLVVSLRALAGYNVTQQGFLDATGVRVEPPAASFRVEMDFSWRLRGGSASAKSTSIGAL